MSCLIIALMRAAIKETTRKRSNNKMSKNKNFTAKTQYLNLKGASNNVKTQSDKALATRVYFFLNTI